ncbi:MAG: hypothetical protein Q9181_001738 [Wetmoreana brouardii]
MRFVASLLFFFFAFVTPQVSTDLPYRSEVSTSSTTTLSNSYHGLRCNQGPVQKPDVAISCIRVLAQMRSESAQPRSFNYQEWQDRPGGCLVRATKTTPGSTVVVRDLPDAGVFMLYRCFLADGRRPARSADIFAGENGGYLLELVPPPVQQEDPAAVGAPSLQSTPANPPGLADDSPSIPTIRPSLQVRARVQCASLAPQPTGAYTDCLATMLNMLNEPGSGIPMTWERFDARDWDAPNCVITISLIRGRYIRDLFTERSLISDALWILGKCFTGSEAASGYNSGEVSVGPLKRWKLKVIWGLSPTKSTIGTEANSSVSAMNGTRPLLPVAPLESTSFGSTS